jgi:hypothetical protein
VSRVVRSPLLVIFGWAVVGLLIGHVAAYDVVYPDGHIHAQVLEASGHQWLWLLEPSILLGVLIAAIAGFVGSRSGSRREARFCLLATIQVGAFLGMELVERLAHGITLPDIAHELTDHGLWLVLAIGVVAQLLTAWLGSAASRSIADAARAHPRQPVARPARPHLLPPITGHPAGAPAVRANGSRAPPGRLGLQLT